MTITELAKQLGVSKGTIYNKLKASGIELDSIRDGGGNDLSNSGIQIISSMFDRIANDQSEDTPKNQTQDADLKIEIAVLKERIAALERENELLRSSIEDWKEQAKSSQRLLTGYVEKPSLFARFFARKQEK